MNGEPQIRFEFNCIKILIQLQFYKTNSRNRILSKILLNTVANKVAPDCCCLQKKKKSKD